MSISRLKYYLNFHFFFNLQCWAFNQKLQDTKIKGKKINPLPRGMSQQNQMNMAPMLAKWKTDAFNDKVSKTEELQK